MSERRRVSYANIMSTIAVVLALTTSGAYAAGIGKNAVKAKHIAPNAVRAKHIASNAVQGSDITKGAVDARSLANNAVDGSKIQDGSVGTSDLAGSSVTDSKIATNGVGTSEIKNESIKSEDIQNGTVEGEDVKEGSISSARMTTGVRDLLFGSASLGVNQTFGDVTVSNGSWPGGAPDSGAAFTLTWTQPANTLDVVSGYARLAYPAACSQTSSSPGRGLDVKIADAGGRVISSNSPQYDGSTYYNGNGFWDQQAALPGVTYRAPFSVDLANDPQPFVDYIHFPIEMPEFVSGGSTASRAVRVFMKRSSSACSPEVTDARMIVMRYPLP